MPSTLDIRRRIRSVKSTRQITRAMELVSAAKMRKAQNQALATRTYSQLAWELLQNAALKSDTRIHRLLRAPAKTASTAIILMTSNRGLIGAFNNNIIEAGLRFAKQIDSNHISFITMGKKGRDAVKNRGYEIVADFEKLDSAADVAEIYPLSKLVTDEFIAEKFDKVVLVYMQYVTTLVQKPKIQEILPLRPIKANEPDMEDESSYLFEPTPDQVLEVLLPRLTTMQIYQALLETNASEHSARMVAMKNASDAALDLVNELTLEYNQIRQAAITKEISEIVSGRLAIQES